MEISVNLLIGLVDHSLTINKYEISNCTYYFILEVTALQEAEGHFYNGRPVLAIT